MTYYTGRHVQPNYTCIYKRTWCDVSLFDFEKKVSIYDSKYDVTRFLWVHFYVFFYSLNQTKIVKDFFI